MIWLIYLVSWWYMFAYHPPFKADMFFSIVFQSLFNRVCVWFLSRRKWTMCVSCSTTSRGPTWGDSPFWYFHIHLSHYTRAIGSQTGCWLLCLHWSSLKYRGSARHASTFHTAVCHLASKVVLNGHVSLIPVVPENLKRLVAVFYLWL